jgi:putative ABC transport system substrate-binding protein
MRRRQFISLLGGAAVAYPFAARAQQSERVRRVGVLMSTTENDVEGQARIDAFLQGLRQAGWAVPGNVRIETRWGAGDAERIRKDAAELVTLAPDVILASGGSVVGPLLKLTRTVPIVFTLTPDPVGAGFVQSLAHPGGNATGFTSIEYGMSGKWLELMREIAPGVTRVAVLRDPTLPAGIAQFAVLQTAAPSLGMELSSIGGRDPPEIEGAVTEFARASNGGLIVLGSAVTVLHRDLIIALAARHALPAVYPGTYFVTSGGLISYSADSTDPHRRAAGYVDRILKGDKPARTRSSTSWRSTSRPQRRSASKFPTGCSRSPTR